MESLLKTLPAIMKAAGDSTEVAEAACFVAWKQIVGEALRGNAVPVRLDDRTLVIAVADATWQKQMQSLSGQLLFRLNSLLGQPVVTYLEFCEDPETVTQARLTLTESRGDAGTCFCSGGVSVGSSRNSRQGFAARISRRRKQLHPSGRELVTQTVSLRLPVCAIFSLPFINHANQRIRHRKDC